MYTSNSSIWKVSDWNIRNPICIGCLNMHGIHLTTNTSTTNNVVLFFFQIWKYYTFTTINPLSQCLRQERTKNLRHYLFGDKNHLKLSQNICNQLIWWWFITQIRSSKRLHVLGADIIIFKKTLIGCLEVNAFLPEVFQMITIALV